MERRILLETLADRLPPDAISFASKLAKIEKSGGGETLLEFMDGTRISAKVFLHMLKYTAYFRVANSEI